MEVRELTCIGCPLGCQLTVTMGNDEIKVEGNTCPRGEAYAKKEVTNPTRIVTSTVRAVKVAAPVHIGEVIIADCAGTGGAVVASKNVGRA